MTKSAILGALAATSLIAGSAGAATIADVQERGTLRCGVAPSLPGFATPPTDGTGSWQGFDVDLCRAVAAAVLGDPQAVEFVPTGGSSRFETLTNGDIDILARNTSWTFSRDADLDIEFAGINYYDGQGFLVPTSLGITSARDLDGARICVQTGTTSEMNLADFFRRNSIDFEAVPVESNADAQQSYLDGDCQAYTSDASGLAATRANFANPADHVILPEIISKEPLGPLVAEGDRDASAWADVVRWTLNALVTAEEYGVNSTNVQDMASSPGDNPEVNRLLGNEGNLGEMLGLSPDWAVQAISANGNYGEIFEKNIGENTPIGLSRGLNALWTEGGLLYSPPFR